VLDQVLRVVLKNVIENEHQRTAHASDHVGKGSLVKREDSFVVVHAGEALERVSVHFLRFGLSRLHHHAPTHSVCRVGKQSCQCHCHLWIRGIFCFRFNICFSQLNYLCEKPLCKEVEIFFANNALAGIPEAEVGAPVQDDADQRDPKSSIETEAAVRAEDFGNAVPEAVEFSILSIIANVGGESGASKIKRVDHAE
jgi:hypothetical protein